MRLISRAAMKRVRCIFLATGVALALGVPAANAQPANPQGVAYAYGQTTATNGGGHAYAYAYGRPIDAGTGHKVG